ncbi:hypothetical protein I6N90_09075 [Paenibacillus sp. GSMTC-2017]|uniref:hypothetical protein n=1 Tax=Paenibacillus sp. GSMTC-2017 TaxID=2794350 RepID=UPI0018D8529A|nr:hypothetical protein [Paenibacillus sp. GSMTC-2017]MBH5317955.1 hypothetical protein [Paenibacillus sp. GSMTC-2017]
MDKRKVIDAYRHGFITIQQCAQIIGVDNVQMSRLVNDSHFTTDVSVHIEQRTLNTL